MDRRSFFSNAIGKASEMVVEHADRKVASQAVHWVRPPFALPELEFLLTCTRCGDCIDACPHQVVFPLSARRGTRFAATPALDLLHKGCHLCADWPCVKSCSVGALQLPEVEEDEQPATPTIAKASVDTATCLPYKGPECGACAGSCPVPGALTWDRQKPRINAELCVGCGLCREACILEPKAIRIESLHKAAVADTP
ncbi:MAG: 4Fe-4S dicluster domain-containing protein [Proteobacteria bacterium]|nr:4Fe-4S dicluster domain-containing protein [Pseudomonadota bacterium]